MRHEPVRTGFLSLLMLVILLCLAVLSVLSLATARADWMIAQKQAQVQQERWSLEAQGQQWLAQVCAAVQNGEEMPSDTQWEDGIARTTLTDGTRSLHVAVQLDPFDVLEWRQSVAWEADPTTETLWGN